MRRILITQICWSYLFLFRWGLFYVVVFPVASVHLSRRLSLGKAGVFLEQHYMGLGGQYHKVGTQAGVFVPGIATSLLSRLEQIPLLPCASVSPSLEWENDTACLHRAIGNLPRKGRWLKHYRLSQWRNPPLQHCLRAPREVLHPESFQSPLKYSENTGVRNTASPGARSPADVTWPSYIVISGDMLISTSWGSVTVAPLLTTPQIKPTFFFDLLLIIHVPSCLTSALESETT